MNQTWQIEINSVWVDLPVPSVHSWSYQDISSDESGRDLSVTMHKDVIGVKRKNECVWWAKTSTVSSTIMKAAKSKVFVKIRYPDPFDNAIKTIECYTGDISARQLNSSSGLRWEISLSFVEK